MKLYLYTIYAYVGNDYCQVVLNIKATNEKDALKKAKKLVKREVYMVEQVQEIK